MDRPESESTKREPVTAQQKSQVVGRMSHQQLATVLTDVRLPSAERLAWAFKIHTYLCEHVDPAALEDNIDQMTDDLLISALLSLARVTHTLNYIVFRTLLLFTFTTKSLKSVARLGIIQVVMSNLRRPQEVQCLRYSIGLLHRVCSSPHCRTVKVLSHFVHQDAVTLWSVISGHSEVSFARLQVLTILSSMLLTHKGRQALQRAGSIYAVLDLLAHHKRGSEYFSKAELATLHMLKRELVFWEDVDANGWVQVVAKRAQIEQRQLAHRAQRSQPQPKSVCAN